MINPVLAQIQRFPSWCDASVTAAQPLRSSSLFGSPMEHPKVGGSGTRNPLCRMIVRSQPWDAGGLDSLRQRPYYPSALRRTAGGSLRASSRPRDAGPRRGGPRTVLPLEMQPASVPSPLSRLPGSFAGRSRRPQGARLDTVFRSVRPHRGLLSRRWRSRDFAGKQRRIQQ